MLQNPTIADNEAALLDKYKLEVMNNAVNAQFDEVKQQIKTIVEKEFARTTPFAEAYKAEASRN